MSDVLFTGLLDLSLSKDQLDKVLPDLPDLHERASWVWRGAANAPGMPTGTEYDWEPGFVGLPGREKPVSIGAEAARECACCS